MKQILFLALALFSISAFSQTIDITPDTTFIIKKDGNFIEYKAANIDGWNIEMSREVKDTILILKALRKEVFDINEKISFLNEEKNNTNKYLFLINKNIAKAKKRRAIKKERIKNIKKKWKK